MLSLQETHAPHSTCFGCGPANAHGLRIRSFAVGDSLVADWYPETWHEAFPNCLNGGIVGALLDCHSNWCAAWKLMSDAGSAHPPCTVTAEFAVKLRRPTPTDGPVHLVATPVKVDGDRVYVEARLESHDKICATCTGLFVSVGPGHPGYHRWEPAPP